MSLAKLMVPIGHPVLDGQGRITRIWEQFFRTLASGVDTSLTGVMYQSTYDPTASGSVVDSDKLGGQAGSYYLDLGNATGYLPLSQSQFETVSLTISDNASPGQHVRADATGGAISVYLPAASVATNRLVIVTKVDSSVNAVTVTGNGSETINGSNTYALASQWDSAILVSDGSSWVVVAKK